MTDFLSQVVGTALGDFLEDWGEHPDPLQRLLWFELGCLQYGLSFDKLAETYYGKGYKILIDRIKEDVDE